MSGMKLTWDDDVPKHISKGYKVSYWARSIQDEVERLVGRQVAHAHAKLSEEGLLESGMAVNLGVSEEERRLKISSRRLYEEDDNGKEDDDMGFSLFD